MATDNVVEVKIRADASGFTAGAREAGGALSGLTDSLKEWRTHVRTEAKYTQFMAMQISGLGIASKGAAAEITGLVSAFAFGNTLGLAIESAKMLVKHFMEVAAETARTSELTKLYGADLKAMGEEGAKHVGTLKKSITDTLLAMRELRSETMLRHELEGPLKREKELKEKIAELDQQIAAGAESYTVTELGVVRQDVSLLEDRKAKLEEELRKVKAEMAGISKAIAPLGADEKRDARLQELIEEAKFAAAQATLDNEINLQRIKTEQERNESLEKLTQDHLLRQGKAEYDAAIAVQKMKDEQLAYQRKRVLDEEAKEDEAFKKREQKVKQYADHVASAISGAINSIIDGTRSVGDAMVEMVKGMAKAVIDTFVKTAVEGILAAVTGTALAKVAATKQVAAHTATAAAGAAAAMASIPFAGPILAHAAAAEMVSFLGGLTQPLLSAAGGLGRVPKDMPVMVHKNETILPADLAEAYRQGAPGGGGGGGGITIIVNTVYADAEGMRKLPQDPDFQRGMREAMRNGRL